MVCTLPRLGTGCNIAIGETPKVKKKCVELQNSVEGVSVHRVEPSARMGHFDILGMRSRRVQRKKTSAVCRSENLHSTKELTIVQNSVEFQLR